jgi:uncharacterized protein (DUF697 family)/GTP-binding protein EngB required for normal cell division
MQDGILGGAAAAAMAVDWDRLTALVDEALAKQRTRLGKINIIVAGRTGVGKSTLVNAVFGTDFARTAMGRPVTTHAVWYERDNHPLRILDTKGLETAAYEETWAAVKTEVEKGRSDPDPTKHIHMGWVCVQEPALRFEDAEQRLVELLKSIGIPVIVVLTKHGMFPEFREEVARLAPMADAVIPVRSLPMPGLEGTAGLDELVLATTHLLPDATRSAFIAAQRIDLKLKSTDARKIVWSSAALAATAAAVPLPFSDAVAIVPIQIGMITGISLRFGIEGTSDKLVPLASSVIGCIAATAAGRIIAGQLLKLVPGGSVVTGGVAASLTTGLGEAYIAFLLAFHKREGRMPSVTEITEQFRSFWNRWRRKGGELDENATGPVQKP